MGKFPALLAGLLTIASLLPFTLAAEAELVDAVVWTADAGAVGALGARVVEHYGAFVLASAPGEALAGLAQRWLVEPVSTLISKGTVQFDTRQGDVPLPEGLRASPEDPYLVVQLIGPVKGAWRARLAELGAVMDYLPDYAFVVRSEAGAEAFEALPFVRFVAPFHPAYKLAEGLPAQGPARFDVAVWGGEPVEPVKARVEELGGQVLGESVRDFESYLRVALPAEHLAALARLPAVNWIQPFEEGEPLDNSQARWVTQSGYPPQPDDVARLIVQLTNAPIGPSVHDKGLTGKGQLLADADTGLDTNSATSPTRFTHDAFNDPNVQFVWGGTPNPLHRKVHAYFRLTEGGVVKGDFDDSGGHGTHTSGSITSDLAPWGQYNSNDGQSFGGRFVFMDWSSLPVDYFNTFDPTYQVGARLHSNSYGSPHSTAYLVQARQNDQFTWSHPDFLIFRSMGNTYGNTIRPEAVAKNVVSSGATKNGQEYQDMADFSSRGPTQDFRVKPTVVAPGAGVTSTYLNNGYQTLSGTSMSTPTTAGAAGLVREYFQNGWYPGGSEGSSAGFNPSAALVRGALINSAVPIFGSGTGRPGLTSNPGEVVALQCLPLRVCPSKLTNPNWPNGDMGWGIVRLDNTLKFAGDAHGLFVVDGASLGTGGSQEFKVTVDKPAAGLKVTLAWSDAPAAVGANPALVNDLDLVVVLPNGVELKGNVFAGVGGGVAPPSIGVLRELGVGSSSGQVVPAQSAPGGQPDRRNVEEQFVLSYAPAGEYTLRVVGVNVPSGSQPFAVLAAGGI